MLKGEYLMIYIRLALLILVVVNLIYYAIKKSKMKKESKEILKDQINTDGVKVHNKESVKTLETIHKIKLEDSKYIEIAGEYSEIVTTVNGSSKITEKYIGPHKIKLPVTGALLIGDFYLMSGYFYKDMVVVEKINEKSVLKGIDNLLSIPMTGEKDKSSRSLLGTYSIIGSSFMLLILFLTTTSGNVPVVLGGILVTFFSILLLVIEPLVHSASKKNLYKVGGYYNKTSDEEGEINGVPINGKELSKIQEKQYITVEGVMAVGYSSLEIKKINNKVVLPPKKGILINSLLLVVITMFSFLIFKTITHPDYKTYLEYSKGSTVAKEFSTYEEIDNYDFKKGQKVILHNLNLYQKSSINQKFGYGQECELIKTPIVLSPAQKQKIDKIYSSTASLNSYFSTNKIDDSLSDEKKEILREATAKFSSFYKDGEINKITILVKNLLKEFFINENLTLKTMREKTEDSITDSITLNIPVNLPQMTMEFYGVVSKRPFQNPPLNFPQRKYIENSLVSHRIDVVTGYINRTRNIEGEKSIAITSFDPFEYSFENYEYINILLGGYLVVIFLLVLVLGGRILVYIKQKNIFEGKE